MLQHIRFQKPVFCCSVSVLSHAFNGIFRKIRDKATRRRPSVIIVILLIKTDLS